MLFRGASWHMHAFMHKKTILGWNNGPPFFVGFNCILSWAEWCNNLNLFIVVAQKDPIFHQKCHKTQPNKNMWCQLTFFPLHIKIKQVVKAPILGKRVSVDGLVLSQFNSNKNESFQILCESYWKCFFS